MEPYGHKFNKGLSGVVSPRSVLPIDMVGAGSANRRAIGCIMDPSSPWHISGSVGKNKGLPSAPILSESEDESEEEEEGPKGMSSSPPSTMGAGELGSGSFLGELGHSPEIRSGMEDVDSSFTSIGDSLVVGADTWPNLKPSKDLGLPNFWLGMERGDATPTLTGDPRGLGVETWPNLKPSKDLGTPNLKGSCRPEA